MTDQSIFNAANSEATPPANQNQSNGSSAPNVDPIADLLGSIKNERGEQKYKDVQEALKGLQNSQEYIPTIKSQLTAAEQEKIRLQAEVDRLRTIEDTVAALTSQQQSQGIQQAPAGMNEEQIAELVNRTLTRKEQENVQRSNLTTVVSTLQQSFGADAEKKYNEKAKELGMSVTELNTLAAKSPKAVLSMLGVTGQPAKQDASASNGSVNTSAFQPKPETFVSRNQKSALIGATTEDLKIESANARGMVEELHAQGLSVHDLTDPKKYNQFFNRK